MPVKIVNPLAQSNGTGSLISPLNAWPSSFSPGDEVLQVAGTVWSGQNTADARYNILVGQSGTEAAPIICGVCEPQTGVRIRDGSKKARVNGVGRQIGVRTGGGISWVTFDGFEVFNVTGTGSTSGVGMYLGSAPASIATRCKITNSHIHDIPNSGFGDDNAIQVFGQDCEVSNVRIHDIADDGIWCQGPRNVIEYNRIERVGQGPDITGDGIQYFGDATLGNSGGIIRFNYIHNPNDEKQGIIYSGHTSTSRGGRIYGNYVRHYRNPVTLIIGIYVEVLDTAVWGNVVEDSYFGILASTSVNGSGTGSRIFGNVVRGSRIGLGNGTAVNLRFFNNTVVETLDYGIYVGSGDVSTQIMNNIVYRCYKGIGRWNGTTENYNCLFGTVDVVNKYTSLGGGAVTMGANTIEADPLLTSDYRLTAASSCRGAGVYIPGARHMGGKRLRSTPDIGAYPYLAPRALADERPVRLVGA